jgi:hypothetical protein
VLTKLKLRALLIGAFVYVIAVLGFSILGTVGANIGPLSGLSQLPFFWVIFWLSSTVALVAGGIAAGWVAGERGLLHGFVVGLIGALAVGLVLHLIFLLLRFDGVSSPIPAYILASTIFTTLGGSVGELYHRRRSSI